jgi:DNA topoisomerase-6 subunit B
VSIELEGKYQRGRGSVDEFLELTAIANPHAKITFVTPSRISTAEDAENAEEELGFGKKRKGKAAPASDSDSETKSDSSSSSSSEPNLSSSLPDSVPSVLSVVNSESGGVLIFPRAVAELPPETKEIQPHPRGIELGILLQMIKEAEAESKSLTLYHFLQEKFSRVSASTASTFCESIKATSRTKLSDIDHAKAETLFKAMQDAKLPPPPTDCLAPIGVRQLLAGLLKGVRAEFYAASSREPDIYRGRPFLIEAAIAFGGDLPGDQSARVIRFANRVPLQYQQSACSSFKAVAETNWRNYDLQHPKGSAPIGPIVIMIHMASVWVPFTSESKEAIADYDEIRKEMRLALMECGRKLGTYLRKRMKMRREAERRDVFERYIGEVAKAINAITGEDAKKLYDALLAQARKRTAIADQKLDDEGKRIKDEDPADQEGVIIVEAAMPASLAPARDTAEDDESKGKPRKRTRAPKSGAPATSPRPEAKPRASKPHARQEAAPSPGLFPEPPSPPPGAKRKVIVKKRIVKKKS